MKSAGMHVEGNCVCVCVCVMEWNNSWGTHWSMDWVFLLLEGRRDKRAESQNPQQERTPRRQAISSRHRGAAERKDTCGRSAEEPPDVGDLAGEGLFLGMRDSVGTVVKGLVGKTMVKRWPEWVWAPMCFQEA